MTKINEELELEMKMDLNAMQGTLVPIIYHYNYDTDKENKLEIVDKLNSVKRALNETLKLMEEK